MRQFLNLGKDILFLILVGISIEIFESCNSIDQVLKDNQPSGFWN